MTDDATPTLASPQRLEALRALRAEMDAVLEMVARGALDVSDVLTTADGSGARSDAAAMLYVVAVVEAVPRIGKVAARRLLADLGIPETTKLGDLGGEDRRRLVAGMSS